MFFFRLADDDFTHLLTHLEFGAAQPRFDERVFGNNPLCEHIPVENIPHPAGTLLIERNTGGWALLEPREWEVYRLLHGTELHRVAAAVAPAQMEELKQFVVYLYWLGLLRIRGRSFFEPGVWQQGPLSRTRSLALMVPTDRCNLSCHYCSANAGSNGRRKMDWPTAQKIVDLILAIPSTTTTIIFHGGEPLLALDLVESVVGYANDGAAAHGKTLAFRLQTNGTLLTPRVLDRLHKLDIQLGLSLDGDRLVNDRTRVFPGGGSSYDAICRGLHLAHARGMRFGVIAVVSKANHDSLPALLEHFVELGISHVKLNPISRLGRARTSWDKLALSQEEFLQAHLACLDFITARVPPIVEENTRHMVRNIGSKMRSYMCMRSCCGAGQEFFAFAPDGRIFPCDRFRSNDELCLASINELTQLTGSLRRHRLLSELAERATAGIPVCRRCTYQRFCEAGCTLETYLALGTMAAARSAHPWCRYYRFIYAELFAKLIKNPPLIRHFCPEALIFDRPFLIGEQREQGGQLTEDDIRSMQ